MELDTEITISELNAKEIVEVSALLADSMSTNPNHLSIFRSCKPSVVEKQKRMFELVLKNPNNKSFTAKMSGHIVGTMTYTTSEHCQLKPFEIVKSMPRLLNLFGIYLLPILRWRMTWSRHDCKLSHNHFGPLAVHTDYQGMGIGKRLLKYYREYLDLTGQIGYLETDRKENIGLYEKFGFQIIAIDRISGIENWFMVRKPNEEIDK